MSTPSAEVVRVFTRRVGVAIDYHRELLLAVHLKKRQASLESMLSEQFVLNIAVLWEVFLSDVVMAYVAEEPSTYLRTLKQRMEVSIRDRFGSTPSRCVRIKLPQAISVGMIPAWVDPKDFNLTFKSADILASKASELLAAPHAKKFALAQDDRQLFDYVVALRNFLAHRSLGSRAILKTAASGLSGVNAALAGDVGEIGSYLKKKVPTDTRSAMIATRLSQIAAVF